MRVNWKEKKSVNVSGKREKGKGSKVKPLSVWEVSLALESDWSA